MSDAIIWHPGVDRLDANPAATVALDRARWESLGATFAEADDGDGETPGLAVGQVNGIDFGVLDYGEEETFLLVADEARAATSPIESLLQALRQAGALDVDRELVVVSGERVLGPALEQRVVTLSELGFEELKIAVRLAEGETSGQIAIAMGITQPAVRFHLANLRRKLGVADDAELAELVRRTGPQPPGRRADDPPSRVA